jgi:predicted XRE-type DNA-binding protein
MRKEIIKGNGVFPPQEEFERALKRIMSSERRTNVGLHPNASDVEKSKHKICKTISRYQEENDLTEKELAKKLGITHARIEKVLFCHIDELNLEELMSYLEKLSIPSEVKIDIKYVWKGTSSQAR